MSPSNWGDFPQLDPVVVTALSVVFEAVIPPQELKKKNFQMIACERNSSFLMVVLREGVKKKLGKSGQADRFGGGGGGPPLQPDRNYL